MKKKFVVFFTLLFGLLCLCVWIKPADAFSQSERRGKKQFPQVNFSTLWSGKFMKEFESYAQDQFPFRDNLRGIKNSAALYLLQQKDVNERYEYAGYLCQMEYPLDEKSLYKAADKFKAIYEQYFQGKDMKVYFSVIPDKNYFLAGESGHLSLDYQKMFAILKEQTSFMQYIDISKELSIENYYQTDTHWKQDTLLDLAAYLAENMGAECKKEYKILKYENPFYGVYHGQMALGGKPENLYYCVSEKMEDYMVYDYENQKEIGVYDFEKAKGADGYELFLSGPLSLISIENPNASTDKELILFRDSFGSSLAPLLAEAYKKITLVDIRYLSSKTLGQWIDFENQDVLFLYSTSVLNHSEMLK